MPITGAGWEFHVTRKTMQVRGTKKRTVGSYQVYHNGVAAGAVAVGDVLVPLSGTTAESPGPSQNDTPATSADPSRILAKRYRLATSGGPMYVTKGYRTDLKIAKAMPGIELLQADTGGRSAILIHPGKNEFLSSIGCINLCTMLPDGNENIDYAGSRRRVIALIEDMKQFLNGLPASDQPILNAFCVIDGDPMLVEHAVVPSTAGTVDGNALAAQYDIGVKNAGVKIAALHAKMAAVFPALAQARTALGLPKPVITSGNDSNHSQGSLHFKNRALDIRGNNISNQQGEAFEQKMKELLGAEFDVIFETFPNYPPNDHLHIEYDPG